MAAGNAPQRVRSGGDTLEISGGEARVLSQAERRSHDVVYGEAVLKSAGQETRLTPAHTSRPRRPPPRPLIRP